MSLFFYVSACLFDRAVTSSSLSGLVSVGKDLTAEGGCKSTF